MHSVKNQIQCWGFVSILIIFRVLLADVPLKSESHESENDPIMTPTGKIHLYSVLDLSGSESLQILVLKRSSSLQVLTSTGAE
jgi:hypothetical protein